MDHTLYDQTSSNYGKVPAVLGSIVVIGMLICFALLHFMCDLKAVQINMQYSLIQEYVCIQRLYEFELVHNAMEATKNICYVKDKGTVDHSKITK